jgi:hypothetical protein
MGYIPALFVLFSGGFLWGIVVYNSLKARLNILLHKLEKIRLLVNERNLAVQAILNEAEPSQVGNFVDDPFLKLQEIEYSIRNNFIDEESKAKLWLNNLQDVLKNYNFRAEGISFLKDKMNDLNRELLEYVKYARQYNSMIESKPTSFMAALLNFKKVSL